MAKLEITQTFYAPDRAAWRQWLTDHPMAGRPGNPVCPISKP